MIVSASLSRDQLKKKTKRTYLRMCSARVKFINNLNSFLSHTSAQLIYTLVANLIEKYE